MSRKERIKIARKLIMGLCLIIPVILFVTKDKKDLKSDKEGKHLFILSGQSNMLGIDERYVNAILEKEFGIDNFIMIKSAFGAKPIRFWYEEWNAFNSEHKTSGAIYYDSLMNKVYNSVADQNIGTVHFWWMQGESDAREGLGQFYEKSFLGLYEQLCRDLNKEQIFCIIGRINDFEIGSKKFAHWDLIREIQKDLAESRRNFTWVNTDDLNDGLSRRGELYTNDLHMSAEGYKKLAERFAAGSVQLIDKFGLN